MTHARLRDDVVITLLGRLTAVACAFVLQIALSHLLGPGAGAYGDFTTALSISLILLQIGSLGVPVSNAYLVARKPSLAGALAGTSLLIAVVVGGIEIAGVLVFHELFPHAFSQLGTQLLFLAVVPLPALLASANLVQLLLGLGKARLFALMDVAQPVAAFVMVMLLGATFGVTAESALAVVGLSFAVSVAVGLIALRRHGIRLSVRHRMLRDAIAFGGRIYLGSLVMFLLLRIDLQMVYAYQGNDAAGIYSIATGIADGLVLLPIMVGINLLPRIAVSEAWEEAASVFRNLSALFLLVCIAAVVASPLIPLIYGDAFSDSVITFIWLAPGVFGLGMTSILANYFGGRGMPLRAVLVWVPGLVLNVVANVLLLPGREPWVASANASAGYLLVFGLMVALFARETGHFGLLVPRPRETVQFIRVVLGRA